MNYQLLRLIRNLKLINYHHQKCRTIHNQSNNQLISYSKELETTIPKINALDVINNDNIEFVNEIRPTLKKSFNLAAYINVSDTLQQLLQLNVNLSKIDKDTKLASFIISCNFKNDIEPLILLLLDNGVDINEIGHVFTSNPYLFTIPLNKLNNLINYFKFRKFTQKQDIGNFFKKCPKIFNLNVEIIDENLANLSVEYKLNANNIRQIVRNDPKIILMKNYQLKKCTFLFSEEMGFKSMEINSLLLKYPILWTRQIKNQQISKDFLRSFDYVHTTMGIDHEQLLKFPLIITRRVRLIRDRHRYLQSLNRNQYDPTKPLYVPLSAFYQIDDSTFCIEYAKTCIDHFNKFLKTL